MKNLKNNDAANVVNTDAANADAVIIGGGPAGLNAALMLGRARKRTIVIDAGRPRNAVTREAHGFLTRDGIAPFELRRIAIEQLGAYPSVSHLEDTVVSVTGEDGAFLLETASGLKISSRKLLFAAGMKDRRLDIPGLSEVYGKSAFVCPYCDGWELRDQPLAVISRGLRSCILRHCYMGGQSNSRSARMDPMSSQKRNVRNYVLMISRYSILRSARFHPVRVWLTM